MGRITTIETTAASGLPQYNNLKIIVRGKPRFIDPQLDGGTLRFAIKRGFNFSAIIPDNQVELAENAYKDSYQIIMESRPSWMGIDTLIRIGDSEVIGELHIVNDTIDANGIGVSTPLISNYNADKTQEIVPVVSLVGTPCTVYSPGDLRLMKVDSWYKIVPSDVILMSSTPAVLESLQEYPVKRADFIGTRAGLGDEPATIYQYYIELATKTGLLPFVPEVGLQLYLKAMPLFFRGEWGSGDIAIPADVGPCVLDAFFGGLLNTNTIDTKLGIQAWDSFGLQTNSTPSGYPPPLYNIATTYSIDAFVVDTLGVVYKSLVDNNLGQPLTDSSKWLKNSSRVAWQEIPSNYLILERAITSDSLLFWQRITGNFQYQKAGYFQAELNSEGKFCFSTGLLVPKWPTDHEYGWVIPLFSRSDVTCVVQYEPQEQQIFEIPSNTLTFIRPHVKVLYNTIMSGQLPLITAGDRILTSSIVCTNLSYTFTVVAASAEVGATYTNNGQTYIVQETVAGETILKCSATGAPAGSGNLIKTSGVGDATIVFSSSIVVYNTFTTNVAHGFVTGTKIRFTSTGNLPSGISTNTDYYAVVNSSSTFRLADTLEHAIAEIGIIAITDVGTGMHRCTDPAIDFIASGVASGQYFTVANIKYTIANVTANTFTLTEEFPTTSSAVSYTILELDTTQIDRLLVSFKGSPNSRVEIRDWQYDGTIVSSLSYYILGTKEAFGQKRWLAGGFSVKPLFYNLAVLRARYSDGVSRYNAGYTYV